MCFVGLGMLIDYCYNHDPEVGHVEFFGALAKDQTHQNARDNCDGTRKGREKERLHLLRPPGGMNCVTV